MKTTVASNGSETLTFSGGVAVPFKIELTGERRKQFLHKLEVLKDMEPAVAQITNRSLLAPDKLWYPSDFFPRDEKEVRESQKEETIENEVRAKLRARAREVPDAVRLSLGLNLITEEGLPHFHRLVEMALGYESVWKEWNCRWTAEEDRHGNILRDYIRESRILTFSALERDQHTYIHRGFDFDTTLDPYRAFVYTTLQEAATAVSHANTGIMSNEDLLKQVLAKVASDEHRHFSAYRDFFKEVIARDPDGALISAEPVMLRIDMPAHKLPRFNDYAEVIANYGIYGIREYIEIVTRVTKEWGIAELRGLSKAASLAQEKILEIPEKLSRIAERLMKRSSAKTFRFAWIRNREVKTNPALGF